MRVFTAVFALIIADLIFPASFLAQSSQFTGSNTTISVPRLINVSSVFQPADGQPPAPNEIVTLTIYAEPEGGAPLWQEVQTVAVDNTGRFTVLLGASRPDGLPAEVFASGEAKWMSLHFARPGEVEQSRVRIASVPYALKASDAETLGGRPASAYLLAQPAGDEAPRAAGAGGSNAASGATSDPPSTADVVLPGTTNFLAKYVNGADVGNSAVYESGGVVGIGTTTPFDQLHLRFTNTGGGATGLAVQNLGNTATSYSGMLFYDQFGALGQFQGFNNVTHEYRINNVARNGGGQFDGSINFMIGSSPRFRIDTTVGTTITGPVGILSGSANIGLLVHNSGSQGISVENTNAIGTAIYARGPSGSGVFGSTNTGRAITGFAETSGDGVVGATDTGIAIYGVAGDVNLGWAAAFDGDVDVNGILFKSAGAFRIDHPLDPENKYLSHSFVESPDMKNIYDGVAVFDAAGEAVVTLPDWFESLNRDFRYQLTPMGAAFVPYVAQEVAGNQFKVGGGIPGKKVSWQVTGIRHDAFANANRIQVEELKPSAAVATYLHPEAVGQPAQKGRSRPTADDSMATAKDRNTARADEMKARLRALSQKPAKR